MTNSANDFVLGKHLESLANAVKQFSFAGVVTVEPGGNVLDTVPATVDGGLWYDVENSLPAVKIYYGGNPYSLTNGTGYSDSISGASIDSGFNSALESVFASGASIDSGFNSALAEIFGTEE